MSVAAAAEPATRSDQTPVYITTASYNENDSTKCLLLNDPIPSTRRSQGNLTSTRAGEEPHPPPSAGGAGLTYAHGPHVMYKKISLVCFNVFKIFVKIFVHNKIYRSVAMLLI